MPTPTIAQLLESSRVLITNSRDAEILNLLSNIGIDETYLNKGETLYQEAIVSVESQSKEEQEKSLAYDEFHQSRSEAIQDFDRTFQLVKILSNADLDLQSRLKIKYVNEHPIEEWINNAFDQYTRVLRETAFLQKLARFKIDSQQLEDQKTALIQLRALRNKVNIEKGEAEQATKLKTDKLEELRTFTRELKELSQYALGSQSQLLEKLGIRVSSN